MDNIQAIARYLNHIENAKIALDRIQKFLDDNGEIAPDEVNWGHVGTMAAIASDLIHVESIIDGMTL